MTEFSIITFGCTANISASELMSYLLIEYGYHKTKDVTKADFLVINTCVVKSPTESKIKDFILKYYPNHPLIITGCLPQVMVDWCRKNTPKAALLGVDHFGEICQAAKAIMNNSNFLLLTRQKDFCSEISRDRTKKITGIIEISKGCTGSCAYCIVRLAKGLLVSKAPELIFQEAQKAINDGCLELWFTAQDTASYGSDINSSLSEIVGKISSIDGNFMIRIGMMNADYALKILDGLKQIYRNQKVYSFVHIPVQSGSNQILQKMNRQYTIENYITLINKLRKNQQLTISTDVIIGFPGETEEDFLLTVALLSNIRFDIVNISKYGDRLGTQASKFMHKIPSNIIKERSIRISNLVHQITLERNKEWIGWEGESVALRYDKKDNSTLFRNRAYKLISIKEKLNIGQKYKIKIKDAFKTRLIGSIIND